MHSVWTVLRKTQNCFSRTSSTVIWIWIRFIAVVLNPYPVRVVFHLRRFCRVRVPFQPRCPAEHCTVLSKYGVTHRQNRMQEIGRRIHRIHLPRQRIGIRRGTQRAGGGRERQIKLDRGYAYPSRDIWGLGSLCKPR